MAAAPTLESTELQRLTDIRHDLHSHPELGYQEERTSAVVQQELTEAKIEFKAGLAGGTGVLGYLPASRSPESAPTIALRADMDALPILEATGLPYASQTPGKMHACGHDGHTTILIGTARALAQNPSRPNNVLFVFQPAEEGGGGGKRMCDDGVLQGKVLGRTSHRIFGLHCWPSLDLGKLVTRTGAFMASADGFTLTVTGVGGHAAMPHMTVDPIVISSHIITALQTIASRTVSPLDSVVVTIGKLEAGTAGNVIPNEANMIGTLRTLKPETRELGKRKVEEICEGVARSLGGSAKVNWHYSYPVTYNNAEAAADLRRVLKPAMNGGLVDEDVEPVMGAEDFSFYGAEVPACFYWMGIKDPAKEEFISVHHPKFNFNDEAIPIGIQAMTALALGQF